MNFIEYCELPDNKQWITDLMYTMKAEGGFDCDLIVDAVEEQAEDDGVDLVGYESWDECQPYFATWYDELDYNESCGAV